MRRAVLKFLRRVIGTQQIIDMLDQTIRSESGSRPLRLLPGTEYSRYALPLDYMPSRNFEPRYGYSQEPIQSLMSWFETHVNEYRAFLTFMRSLDISHIALSTTNTTLPNPAWIGGAICAFDALALYAMVRRHTPANYVEIGSGMTTCFARQAVKDGGCTTRITSIDPEPRAEIDEICDDVIRDGLETFDLSYFDRLQAGDIVFFDGSHRSFMNSDVTVFFIDVLPRLAPGVIVHLHDINLPYDYPESFKHWYWNEQYMLAVYMMGRRDSIVPLLPTTFICRSPSFREELTAPFRDLGEQNDSWRGGGSMWFTHRPR